MRVRELWSSSLVAALIGLGCSTGGGPAGPTATVSGTVFKQGSSDLSPYSGVTVRASADKNGDGQVGTDEQVSVDTGSDGTYTLKVPIAAGVATVLRFSRKDAAASFRTFTPAEGKGYVFDASLTVLETLACNAGICATDDNKLSLSGVPEGFKGSGRTFNPASEADAMPGGFEDSAGNMLISAVFAAVELRDGSGNSVSQMPNKVGLRMAMPRDTWPRVVDLKAGDDRIQVPLYGFDEAKGTWVRDGESVLEDGNGLLIPESALAAIRAQTHVGVVVAKGDVSHFSHWNIDWPVSTRACLKGKLLDASGNPATDALITAVGLTFDGETRPVGVTADGSFCVETMRSEELGEDVDQNGKTGELQRITLRVTRGASTYVLGPYDSPKTPGTCAAGSCFDLGTLTLSEDKLRKPALCTITGTVRNAAGAVVANANVSARDRSLDSTTRKQLCPSSTVCPTSALTDAQGAFSVKLAYLDRITVTASSSSPITAGLLTDKRELRTLGCPAQPVTLGFDQRLKTLTLTVTVTGNVIDWTHPELTTKRFTGVFLLRPGATFPLWSVSVPRGAMALGPITYGTVPTGAVQGFPLGGGAPPAFAKGDQLVLAVQYVDALGVEVTGSGGLTIP